MARDTLPCEEGGLTPICIDVHLDAADAETPLKDSELAVLRREFEKETVAGFVAIQTKFNYAWGLIKSQRRPDNLEGVRLLTGVSYPISKTLPSD